MIRATWSSVSPPSADAQALRAALEMRASGQLDAAESALVTLSATRPQNVELWRELAATRLAQRKDAEAAAGLELGLEHLPGEPSLLAMLGVVEVALGRAQTALTHLEAAIAAGITGARVLYAHARSCQMLSRIEDAEAGYRRLLAATPGHALGHAQLSDVLRTRGADDEALTMARRAVELAPADAFALYTLASAEAATGDHDAAIATARRQLALKPDDRNMSFNLSWALLARGQWAEGWQRYEDRLSVYPDLIKSPDLPHWRGEPLTGTLVVIGEQGLGDAMMFARLLPMLAGRVEAITLHVDKRVRRLVSSIGQICAMPVSFAELGAAVPADATAWVPLQSLPMLLDLTPEMLPGPMPYLFAEPRHLDRCKGLLKPGKFNIGINWRGNPKGTIDRGRSVPLELFAPLAMLPDVHLIALHRGAGFEDLRELKVAGRLFPVTIPEKAFDNSPDGFLDSAGLMSQLDLIITCDTSVAHLAGALARPSFVVLKQAAEWRWMIEDDRSPWYPSMRLFRQRLAGDYTAPMRDVAAAVAQWISNRGRPA